MRINGTATPVTRRAQSSTRTNMWDLLALSFNGNSTLCWIFCGISRTLVEKCTSAVASVLAVDSAVAASDYTEPIELKNFRNTSINYQNSPNLVAFANTSPASFRVSSAREGSNNFAKVGSD